MTQILRNEMGRRIGESHPRAVLTDHEIALLAEMLDAREQIIERLKASRPTAQLRTALRDHGLSFSALAAKFEVSKSHVWKIATGRRRCQTPVVG